jgi:hypothetical protein
MCICAFRNTEKQLEEQKQAEAKLDKEIENSKVLCSTLDRELGQIMNDIGDAKVDKFESSRNQKKTEIIEQLKKKFPGVVSGFCCTHTCIARLAWTLGLGLCPTFDTNNARTRKF